MTRDEVLALKPGRELDALVAEKVMGWTDFSPIDPTIDYGIGANGYRRNFAKDPESGRNTHFPFYSTDTAAVWEVEEEIERQNKRVAYCQALKIVLYSKDEYVGMFDYVHASPADRCKAALLAVMDGGERE